MADQALGYALVGCGKFGRFCMSYYKTMPDIRLVAVADTDPSLARATAEEFQRRAAGEPAGRARSQGRRHRSHCHAAFDARTVRHRRPGGRQARARREAPGRHRQRGRSRGRDQPPDRPAGHRQLHPPPQPDRVDGPADHPREGAIGEPLRAYFENYAQDEVLPPSHWFWDRSLSAGIFVEHGVHFFDLYRQWFGPGRVRWAEYLTRPGTRQQDRAFCVMEFGDRLVTHYHGFDQPIRLDRQRHLILCERGDIVVGGWIPLELQVHGTGR